MESKKCTVYKSGLVNCNEIAQILWFLSRAASFCAYATTRLQFEHKAAQASDACSTREEQLPRADNRFFDTLSGANGLCVTEKKAK
jgi:hypothetical protein